MAVTAGTIVAVAAPSLGLQGREVVDAAGAYVMPGAIDAHVHFNVFNPMVDDFRVHLGGRGLRRRHHHDAVHRRLEGMSVVEGLEHFAAEGERRSVVDFAMHCRLRPDAKLIEQIPQSIAYGVTSIKMFQAYKKRGMLFADDQLLRGMELTGAHGGIALVHAENGHVIDYLEDKLAREGKTAPEFYLSSRPHVAESEAVSRAIDIAGLAGCPSTWCTSARPTGSSTSRGRGRAARPSTRRRAPSTCSHRRWK